MGFSLLMKRKVFSIIQGLAVEYEERFGKRKGLTPLITNQLLAEALIVRGLLPEDFLKTEYGSVDPFQDGFAYRGWRSEKDKEKRSQKIPNPWVRKFNNVIKDWDNMRETSKQYYLTKATELIDKVPEAKEILELHNKDKERLNHDSPRSP
jgi:hypothetical protein